MKSLFTGMCVAVGLTTAAFGQQTPTAPATQAPSTPAASQASPAGDQVTMTGCIQREADYRRTQDAGRGGIAGTGVGAANEFILADASMSPAGRTAAPGSAPSATGTSGTSAGAAYELTGTNEGKAAQFVGKRVEITGRLKPAEVGAAAPTGGPTAGAPPRGVDVLSKDLQLRELEVTSVREASGTCAAAPRP